MNAELKSFVRNFPLRGWEIVIYVIWRAKVWEEDFWGKMAAVDGGVRAEVSKLFRIRKTVYKMLMKRYVAGYLTRECVDRRLLRTSTSMYGARSGPAHGVAASTMHSFVMIIACFIAPKTAGDTTFSTRSLT